jgi:hypothetical protein
MRKDGWWLRSTEFVQIGAKLADLKLQFYQTDLVLTSLIECLIKKGYVKRDEVEQMAKDLERELTDGLNLE